MRAALSLIGGVFALLGGGESGSSSSRIEAVKSWIKKNYSEYPKGIEKFNINKDTDVVEVQLSEPLDLDILSNIISAYDLEGEISDAGRGDRVLNIYKIEGNGGAKTKLLQGTFHQTQNISISQDPIRNHAEKIDERLELIIGYLEEKYGEE